MTLQEALKESENIKVRRKTWVSSYYLTVVSNAFIDPTGTHSPLGYTDVIADNWEVYVEPKPCKHEPTPYIYPDFADPKKDAFYLKCKHCGVKIKAVGWEAV